jgi:hypothetical protein
MDHTEASKARFEATAKQFKFDAKAGGTQSSDGKDKAGGAAHKSSAASPNPAAPSSNAKAGGTTSPSGGKPKAGGAHKSSAASPNSATPTSNAKVGKKQSSGGKAASGGKAKVSVADATTKASEANKREKAPVSPPKTPAPKPIKI